MADGGQNFAVRHSLGFHESQLPTSPRRFVGQVAAESPTTALLNWLAQLGDPELQKYRIVTVDLRGHGLSDKPSKAEFYTEGTRWGEDLNTVIVAAGLKSPARYAGVCPGYCWTKAGSAQKADG